MMNLFIEKLETGIPVSSSFFKCKFSFALKQMGVYQEQKQ
jgi:hypothetical protein